WGEYYANPIDYAIYRFKETKNNTLLLVLDGEGSPCITKADNGRYYKCAYNWNTIISDIVPYPAPSKSYKAQAPLIGVLSLCSDNEACEPPESLWKEYGKTVQRSLPPGLANLVANLKIKGKNIKFTTSQAVEVPEDSFDGIKVLSATYLKPNERSRRNDGNATVAAANFLNGKTKETYKISSRFIGVMDTGEDREFEIQWVCSGDVKNKRTQKVSAPAENKVIPISCED
ncbi:MAG: hypothetical protein AAGB31_15570, partial [Bdellovibrio sp.]